VMAEDGCGSPAAQAGWGCLKLGVCFVLGLAGWQQHKSSVATGVTWMGGWVQCHRVVSMGHVDYLSTWLRRPIQSRRLTVEAWNPKPCTYSTRQAGNELAYGGCAGS
jgi:hypothetical protein